MVAPADVDRRCRARDRGPLGCDRLKTSVRRSHGVISTGGMVTFEYVVPQLAAWVGSLWEERAQTCETLLGLGA